MASREKYYSTLGVMAIDVKPSIETALQGELLLKDQLVKLCIWVRAPHSYRPLLWKLVLGVLPLYKPSWLLASKIKKEQYDILKQAAVAIWYDRHDVNEDLTSELMVQMLYIELGKHPPSILQMVNPLPKHLTSIANAFLDIFDEDGEDAFWTFTYFVKNLDIPLIGFKSPDFDLNSALLIHAPELAKHFDNLNVSLVDITSPWFASYFSSVFGIQILEVIWDFVIANETQIILYVAIALLLSSKRKLLASKTLDECVLILQNIEKNVDYQWVIQKSVDLWEATHRGNAAV